MKPGQKLRLGDLLVDDGLISENMLQTALASQKTTRKKLGEALIDLGYITEDQMLEFLSRQLDYPIIDLRHFQFNQELVEKIPEKRARSLEVIALIEDDTSVMIGMTDPTNVFTYEELERYFTKDINIGIVRKSHLLEAINSVYQATDVDDYANALSQELSSTDFNLEDMMQTSDVTDAPVVKMLQGVFEEAVSIGASDIHIEPDDTVLRIRQRVDGMLREKIYKDKRIATAVVSRLKLMSGLDISEKRLPQDGRFNISVHNKSIDVRVSTLPLQTGEAVVMRLLDQSGGTLELRKIGMPADIYERFKNHIHKPHGLVLVTGPTGSGKTTTLYGALTELNDPRKKIITVEDPVEYRLPRINQVQINTQIGLTFAAVLRTALRQDPDVVLIGEMRDQETAEIGLRAAITGHLVMSTLHTNDSVSTAIRLIDMGIPGFMVATSLEAIIAQRLVRKVCDNCGKPHKLTIQEEGWLAATIGEESIATMKFRSGPGCHVCNGTGYRGRVGVFELLEMNDEMMDALRRNDTSGFATAAANNPEFRNLSMNALDYALKGLTSLEEVIRISGDDSLSSIGKKKVSATTSGTGAKPQSEQVEPVEGEGELFGDVGLTLAPME